MPVNEETVHTISLLLEVDEIQAVHELDMQKGLTQTTVLYIHKQWLGMRKIAARWVAYDLKERQK